MIKLLYPTFDPLLKAVRFIGQPFLIVLFVSLSSVSLLNAADQNYEGTSARALTAGNQPELLKAAIQRYRDISEAGGWPVPGYGEPLAVGMRHEDVRLLRRRFRITGDYTAEMGADPLLFDPQLESALRKYQRDHGLPVSGMLGQLTRQALNIEVEERINELQRSLGIWQQHAGQRDGQRLWVNIPEATVSAVAGDRIEMQMRAVVGHPSRPTPVLSSSVNRVVVNPTWTVPKSIALEDLIPRQISDSNYLGRIYIRVYDGWQDDSAEIDPKNIDWTRVSNSYFPYRLRQDPGPFNSLGRMKFIFPNEHDVYLHDTPTRALLGLSYRTLSSGCIRVEQPEVLASWLVSENSRERLETLLASKDYTPESIRVNKKVPIDLVYLTAWVSPDDGSVQFRRDIYGLVGNESLAGR